MRGSRGVADDVLRDVFRRGKYPDVILPMGVIRREVLPYTPDAESKDDATNVGYTISFTRHLYKPKPLGTLEEISADFLAIEREAEGLLGELLLGGRAQ